jgi:hypothetical protein
MKRPFLILVFLIFGSIILAACSGGRETITVTETSSENPTDSRDLEIITLLPRDGIPAIDNPTFISAEEAKEQYTPDELIIGVNFDGDARAYSIPLLSSHEIVNDTVGGRKIAVTW